MTSKVYVGNLGSDPLQESDLEEEFQDYGHIKEIFVARNPPGFAYIDFVSERSAKTAVREMQSRRKICGRKRVKVELSNRARKKRDRERSISPETYRKYGSRTPSPELREESRSRSRSPIRSKPLFWKPNKPKKKKQKKEKLADLSPESSSESATSSDSDDSMEDQKAKVKSDPERARKRRPKSKITKVSKNSKYTNYTITMEIKSEH
ncbi:unnamed protein product [Oikopleura dioica]|uniref:RRM domain-containing protein n=1 Tax=Oikopleura dioica TaxID=34765 RepID=E4X9S4_OIKDI|nr:unnamed protein product [Oikopleura dioica]